MIAQASKAVGLKIDLMQPVAYLLAQQTATLPDPHLILWSGQENIIAVCYRGGVYLAQNVITDLTTQVGIVTSFLQDSMNMQVTNAVISWLPAPVQFPSPWQTQEKILEPFTQIADNKTKGKDEDVLNLDLSKVHAETNAESQPPPSKVE